jgi:hypothetical protein
MPTWHSRRQQSRTRSRRTRSSSGCMRHSVPVAQCVWSAVSSHECSMRVFLMLPALCLVGSGCFSVCLWLLFWEWPD